ncbi:MAG: 4-hydroxythreonine-4-phosphate dehydrogenase PdxA, partial [Bdellovibrionota bacterium]
SEEQDIVGPALEDLREKKIPVEGPLSPDAVFHLAYEGRYDAVIALYHDQGLAPFKLVHFDDGVNLTLGLPFVRTSPDHGTAFDIAWKGKASTESFESAIALALDLSSRSLRK